MARTATNLTLSLPNLFKFTKMRSVICGPPPLFLNLVFLEQYNWKNFAVDRKKFSCVFRSYATIRWTKNERHARPVTYTSIPHRNSAVRSLIQTLVLWRFGHQVAALSYPRSNIDTFPNLSQRLYTMQADNIRTAIVVKYPLDWGPRWRSG